MAEYGHESESESVERKLPDEQNKLEEEDMEGDTELQTMERANNLSQHYEQVKDRTVDDDTVLGILTDINTSDANNNIYIDVDVPGEDSEQTFRFKDPKVWSEDYDFVRWIKHYGYDADSFPGMLEDKCQVKVEQDSKDYDLFIPENETATNRETLKSPIQKFIGWYKEEDVILAFIPGILWSFYAVAIAFRLLEPLTENHFQMFGLWLIVMIIILIIGAFEDGYHNG